MAEKGLLKGAKNKSCFSPKWGSYVRNGNLENKHSNLWGLLKVKIKPSGKLGKTPSCRKLSTFHGSVLFRMSSFWLTLILLLKVSKHETESLGNNKQQKWEAQASACYTCLPATLTFMNIQLQCGLKIKGPSEKWGWRSSPPGTKVRPKQACQTETFESQKSVSIKSRRNAKGKRQAFREYQGEGGAECFMVLGKSPKMANRVPSHVSIEVNNLSLNLRREMGVGRGGNGSCKRLWNLQLLC